ncbi:heme ABC transporter permease [Xanthobacter oligotrophicus]|uniref:heme ABC transporter permease n=1 Tax=Xanthobacter oligotrophicus TaxID=2607286 RepID=UPI0011F0C340|nr:heme ABC transporter permease [Xanthobacter oligotrophicus]MCG5234019.1 heme ABC transporter permease [Xanthobacter oligotrophicus]
MAILDLANPVRFMSLSARILPWIAGVAVVTLAVGFFLAFRAPPDYQQGETVRIMYIHVPFAWLGLFGYSMMAASSIGILVWRHPLADVAHKAAAPVGATFTALCLVTGALWGRPMWGTYWVWDARLTSMLVLLLLYLGLMALRAAIDDPNRAGRAAAVLTLVGFINVPIVKFSVDWWNTLHQPASVFRMGGSTIESSLLWPLLVCAIGFTLLFVALHMLGMRTEILHRRVQALEARAAAEAMA